jgi:hypothetical protein
MMAVQHGDPDCTGTWDTAYHDKMGMNLITCNRCGRGTPDWVAAKAENAIGMLMTRLANEGARLL